MKSPKVQAFLKDIVAVCQKHGLVVTSERYDDLQINLLPPATMLPANRIPLDIQSILDAKDNTGMMV